MLDRSEYKIRPPSPPLLRFSLHRSMLSIAGTKSRWGWGCRGSVGPVRVYSSSHFEFGASFFSKAIFWIRSPLAAPPRDEFLAHACPGIQSVRLHWAAPMSCRLKAGELFLRLCIPRECRDFTSYDSAPHRTPWTTGEPSSSRMTCSTRSLPRLTIKYFSRHFDGNFMANLH